MRIILYIFYLFLIAFYNTIVSDMIAVSGVTIDLAGLLVIMVALYRGEGTVLWFAMAAGIVTATQRLDLMPWEMASLAGVAMTVNQISSRINLDSIISRLITLAGFLLIRSIITTLAISSEDFIFVSYRYILPGVLYTVLLGWLLLLFGDGFISLRRIRV